MTQTAVEWLAEKYNYVTWMRNRDEISAEAADGLRKKYLEQAKEMEKEQIMNAYKHELDDSLGANILAEQYYKEIFKSE